ncbi:MAG: peptidyl-prolyl cis-trans isomerase [Paracoccaceae bacterium]
MITLLKRVLEDPLTHFVLIGLVLYGVSLATRPEETDPRTIRVDAEVQQRLSDAFVEGRGRKPTPAEMDELVDVFLVKEILYREARDLRLDEGDEMMRERLAQRMRLMLVSGISAPEPAEGEVEAWFEENAERYGIPPRVSFRVIGLDGTEADAQALAEEMNATLARGERPAPGRYPLVNFQNRPRPQLVGLLGDAFIDAVEAAEPEVWTALASPRGWQVVQYLGSQAAEIPEFEDVEGEAIAQWRQREVAIEARAALEALMATYPIERRAYMGEFVDLDGEGPDTAEATAQ